MAVPNVVPVPDTIARDGSRDVSAELNTFFVNVPDGSIIKFTPGNYRIDKTVALRNKNDLTILGQGSVFTQIDATGDGSAVNAPTKAARTRSAFRIQASEGIVIDSFTIRGFNTAGNYIAALEAQHGFELQASSADISNCDIRFMYGDFVYFGKDTSGKPSTGRVHNNVFGTTGRQGISVTCAHDVLIDNNTIYGQHRSVFDLEPNPGDFVDTVTIVHNTIGYGGNYFIASLGLGQVDNVEASFNTLKGRIANVKVSSQDGYRRKNWNIHDNTSDTECAFKTPPGCFDFHHVDEVQVVRNTQPHAAIRKMIATSFADGDGFLVTGNSFVGASQVHYIKPDDASTNIIVCGNQITGDGPFNQPPPVVKK